jgi:hypothetical protein
MFVLINGTLHRDPAVRQSKIGKQFTTALLKAGTPTEAQWITLFASIRLLKVSFCGWVLAIALACKAPQNSASFGTNPGNIGRP